MNRRMFLQWVGAIVAALPFVKWRQSATSTPNVELTVNGVDFTMDEGVSYTFKFPRYNLDDNGSLVVTHPDGTVRRPLEIDDDGTLRIDTEWLNGENDVVEVWREDERIA